MTGPHNPRRPPVEGVQALGCGLIGVLANSDARKQAAVEAGAIGVVVNAMQAFRTDLRVLASGAMALATLGYTKDACTEAIALGGIPLLVHALQVSLTLTLTLTANPGPDLAPTPTPTPTLTLTLTPTQTLTPTPTPTLNPR